MTSLQQIKDSFFPTNVEATVMFIDEAPRETKVGKVWTVHINDDKTAMKLAVWSEEQVARLKKGQKIRMSKCSVSMYQGDVQLSLTKDGKIDLID